MTVYLSQPRFPGIVQARAYFDEEGHPRLEIENHEMERLHKLLKEQLKHEPTMVELFNYVKEVTLQ